MGIGVKYLQGWQVNQKVKALNIVCQGMPRVLLSVSYQQVMPRYEKETVQWAGPQRNHHGYGAILGEAHANLLR